MTTTDRDPRMDTTDCAWQSRDSNPIQHEIMDHTMDTTNRASPSLHHLSDDSSVDAQYLILDDGGVDPRVARSRLHIPFDSFYLNETTSFRTISTGSTLSMSQSQPSPRISGNDLLNHFFPEDSSFMFVIFEELTTSTLDLGILQATENQVLHPDRRNHLKGNNAIAINPKGSQYLVLVTHRHVHYGVWRSQLIIILELLHLCDKIDILVPYEGRKSHHTYFAIVMNGQKDTMTDPGFNTFDFEYVVKETRNRQKGSRANIAESFGYSSLSFEATPDKASGCYRPSLKKKYSWKS
jgi:hypothetical protein